MKQLANFGPQFLGIFVIILGIGVMILSIANPDWFFSNSKTFNLDKVQGWINFFGRNTTRAIMIFMSLCMIIFGIFWIWAYSK